MTEMPIRNVFVALIVAVCSGCAMCHTYSSEFMHADSTPCPLSNIGWCIEEIPNVGYVGVNAYISPDNATNFNIRLALNAGITGQWSQKDVTVIDLENKTAMTTPGLDTGSGTGRSLADLIHSSLEETPDTRLGYGWTSDSGFVLKPRIARLELRFPPIVIDGKEIKVPPLRYKEGPRIPVPCLDLGTMAFSKTPNSTLQPTMINVGIAHPSTRCASRHG